MKTTSWFTILGAGSIVLLGACAPRPAPVAQVIYAQPTFDKLGNPSCRPGNIPVGGAYSADLPLCDVISSRGVASAAADMGDDNGGTSGTTSTTTTAGGTGTVPDTPEDPDNGDDTTTGNQNRIGNENQNRNTQQSGGN